MNLTFLRCKVRAAAGSERKRWAGPPAGQAGKMNKKGSPSHTGRVSWTEREGREGLILKLNDRKAWWDTFHSRHPRSHGHCPGMLLPKAHGSKWAPAAKSLLGVSEIFQQENRRFQPPRACFCTCVHGVAGCLFGSLKLC